jgi:hypothetical protein
MEMNWAPPPPIGGHGADDLTTFGTVSGGGRDSLKKYKKQKGREERII